MTGINTLGILALTLAVLLFLWWQAMSSKSKNRSRTTVLGFLTVGVGIAFFVYAAWTLFQMSQGQ